MSMFPEIFHRSRLSLILTPFDTLKCMTNINLQVKTSPLTIPLCSWKLKLLSVFLIYCCISFQAKDKKYYILL